MASRDEQKSKRDALAKKAAERLRQIIVLPILDEIEAGDDPMAKIAEIRKRFAFPPSAKTEVA